MSGDLALRYSTRAFLVMVVIGLALASCKPGEVVEKELAQPAHAPTLLSEPLTATLSGGPISLPPLNTDRPADILQEILYYGGGGGGASNCYEVYFISDVGDWQQLPPHIAYQNPKAPVNWLDSYDLGTCGWIPGERVFISLFLNEQLLDFGGQVYADEWGSVWTHLGFIREYSPGVYRFILNGPNGRISHSVQVNGPQGPTLYHFFVDLKEDTNELLLAGFQPGEKIRIITYVEVNPPGKFQFAGWATVQARRDGQLSLEGPRTAGNKMVYAAIGDLSGEAESIRAFASGGHMPDHIDSVYNPQAISDPSACSGALPTRLAIGDIAQVVADRPSVREGPGTEYATVYGTSLGNGRLVTILDGPVCNDGMLWWKGESGLITLTNGEQHNLAGWMAEESGDEWLLEPIR